MSGKTGNKSPSGQNLVPGASMIGSTTQWTCKSCQKVWIKDKNGLVPDFCMEHEEWYGAWIAKDKADRYNNKEVGCPYCQGGNWIFEDEDLSNPNVVTVR